MGLPKDQAKYPLCLDLAGGSVYLGDPGGFLGPRAEFGIRPRKSFCIRSGELLPRDSGWGWQVHFCGGFVAHVEKARPLPEKGRVQINMGRTRFPTPETQLFTLSPPDCEGTVFGELGTGRSFIFHAFFPSRKAVPCYSR